MPIPQKIIKFLDGAKVKYQKVQHRTVFTAYDKAATLHVPERIVGKTLVVRIDKGFGLVLIPANRNLDKGKLKKVAGVKKIDFVREGWIKKNLKGIKVGVVPPFGSLFKLPTFVDKALLRLPKVFLNSGDYNWSVKIKGGSLEKLIPDLIAGSFNKKR